MSEGEKPSLRLNQMLSSKTTLPEFMDLINQSLNSETKDVLGENAVRKLVQAILSTATFGNIPFDQNAFRAICAVDKEENPLPEIEVNEIIKKCYQFGLFSKTKKGEMVIKGRSTAKNLERLLAELAEYENQQGE